MQGCDTPTYGAMEAGLDFIASTRAIAALNTFQQRLEQLHHESNDPWISTIHCCWLWRQQDWMLCHFASKPTACFATFDLPHVCHCLGSIITISLELSNGFYLEGQTLPSRNAIPHPSLEPYSIQG